jgi:hypothetical protein
MNLRAFAGRRILAAAAVTCAAVVAAAIALAPSAGAAQSAELASAARTAPPACTTSGLVIWLTGGDAAAGTAYYKLEFTNLSGSTCTLVGYPGVSGVGLTGAQIGPSAIRAGTAPSVVTVANGATATATLGIVDVGLYPKSKCGPVTAAGVRVYPPNQTRSKVVPVPFGACAKNVTYLNIAPMQP